MALVGVAVEMISLVGVGPEAVDLDQVDLEVGAGMIVAHMTDTSILMDEAGMMFAGGLERGRETAVIVEVLRELGHGVMIEVGVRAGVGAGAGAEAGAEVEAEARVGQRAAGAGVEAGVMIGMRGLGGRIMTTLLCLLQPQPPLDLILQWLKLHLYLSLILPYLCRVICHPCHQGRIVDPSLELSLPVSFLDLMVGGLTFRILESLRSCLHIKQLICNAEQFWRCKIFFQDFI